jgi:hypothetical protein
MRRVIAAALIGLSGTLFVTGIASADDWVKCTDRINYAGDPRSNAEINGIGYQSGVCPPPIRGVWR